MWTYAEPGEDILCERFIQALHGLDGYTTDFDERVGLRRLFLAQVRADLVGLVLMQDNALHAIRQRGSL